MKRLSIFATMSTYCCFIFEDGKILDPYEINIRSDNAVARVRDYAKLAINKWNIKDISDDCGILG